VSGAGVKVLVVALMAAGLGLAAYKHWILGYPAVPDTAVPSWSVEARLRVIANGGPVKVRFKIPSDPYGYGILEEDFVSDDFGLTTHAGTPRIAEWTVRRASGEQTLYYRMLVYRKPFTFDEEPAPGPTPAPEWEEPYHTAAEQLVSSVRAQSAGPVSLASILVRRLIQASPDDSASLLLRRMPGEPDVVRTAVNLLAYAGISARKVTALEISDGRTGVRPEPWLEVYAEGRWTGIDPSTAEARWPEELLLWTREGGRLLTVEGADDPQLELSVARNQRDAVILAQRRAQRMDSPLSGVSLFDLPLGTQNVYKILLLVPLGALLVIVFRNIIGVQTIGVFMPILIALAFRETGLTVGLLLLIVIVATGLAIRFYLDRLRLLLVPRLSAVVTVVVGLMLAASLFADEWQLDRGLAVALFPIVIMAMTIEHMSVAWEERGPAVALQEGFGSLVVAVAGYFVMINPIIGHVMFTFPELLLVVLALSIALGRYTGYRMTELWRFRSLQG